MPLSQRLRSGFLVPPPELRLHVDRIWFWEAEPGVPLPAILPGTGAELMFHYGARVGRVDANGAVHRLPRAFIPCLRSRSQLIAGAGRVSFVSVRFRGSSLRHYGRLALPDLVDGFSDAAETFGPAASELAEELAALPDFPARYRRLCEFLLGQRAIHARPDPATDRLVEALYYADSELPVAALADQVGLSARQLERVTAGATGLSPKRFRRLARFQHAIRDIYLQQQDDYLATVLAYGYHDQSHFIHECRSFTGQTPRQLIERARVVSHFYNPSLRR